jgi:hypothetical protein
MPVAGGVLLLLLVVALPVSCTFNLMVLHLGSVALALQLLVPAHWQRCTVPDDLMRYIILELFQNHWIRSRMLSTAAKAWDGVTRKQRLVASPAS